MSPRDESFAHQAVEYLDLPPMDQSLTLPPAEHPHQSEVDQLLARLVDDLAIAEAALVNVLRPPR